MLSEAATRFRILLETRTVQAQGVVRVNVSSLNQSAAWASFTEKLQALGFQITEIPEGDRGWLNTELDGLKRQDPAAIRHGATCQKWVARDCGLHAHLEIDDTQPCTCQLASEDVP